MRIAMGTENRGRRLLSPLSLKRAMKEADGTLSVCLSICLSVCGVDRASSVHGK